MGVWEAGVLQFVDRLTYAIGQTGNRHAHIGGAGTQDATASLQNTHFDAPPKGGCDLRAARPIQNPCHHDTA